ncbi:hypothetical protein LX36DRAFT_662274 [Colletotrichum falcatum]|nr:hypothetical protein LX36DRAFT_662274 [Colletotrichum falcatum]
MSPARGLYLNVVDKGPRTSAETGGGSRRPTEEDREGYNVRNSQQPLADRFVRRYRVDMTCLSNGLVSARKSTRSHQLGAADAFGSVEHVIRRARTQSSGPDCDLSCSSNPSCGVPESSSKGGLWPANPFSQAGRGLPDGAKCCIVQDDGITRCAGSLCL